KKGGSVHEKFCPFFHDFVFMRVIIYKIFYRDLRTQACLNMKKGIDTDYGETQGNDTYLLYLLQFCLF
ncbi:MAG: hypothetical protein AB1606_05630, partial [Nitrospirota bacterium]